MSDRVSIELTINSLLAYLAHNYTKTGAHARVSLVIISVHKWAISVVMNNGRYRYIEYEHYFSQCSNTCHVSYNDVINCEICNLKPHTKYTLIWERKIRFPSWFMIISLSELNIYDIFTIVGRCTVLTYHTGIYVYHNYIQNLFFWRELWWEH